MIAINNKRYAPKIFPDMSARLLDLPEVTSSPVIITWNYANDGELFAVCAIVEHYSAKYEVYLQIPYLPHARMDRTKNPSEVNTLRVFANIINNLPLQGVSCLDPHNIDLVEYLFNNVKIITPIAFIDTVLEEYAPDIIIFPDEGARKRYESLISKEYTILHCDKLRDWDSGEIVGLSIMGDDWLIPPLAKILIIDDICSYGGTIKKVIETVKKQGAFRKEQFAVYCTHTEFNYTGPKDLLEEIAYYYTTDSRPLETETIPSRMIIFKI